MKYCAVSDDFGGQGGPGSADSNRRNCGQRGNLEEGLCDGACRRRWLPVEVSFGEPCDESLLDLIDWDFNRAK